MSQRIFFGSLEAQERQRLEGQFDNISQASTQATTRQDQLRQAQPPAAVEYLEIEQHEVSTAAQKEELEKKLELQRQLRRIRVPTVVTEVKSQLRQLGQPVTYFGENAAERRERLRKLLTEHLISYGQLPSFDVKPIQQNNIENQYFLYEGTQELREYRVRIALSSLKMAALRVEQQRLRRMLMDALDEDREAQQDVETSKHFQISMSQFADSAGVSRGTISPNQKYFATAGSSGECALWSLEDASLIQTYNGHLTKCHSIVFHPQVHQNESITGYVATGSGDQTIKLWSLNQSQAPITIKGHEDRINKLLFHQNQCNLLVSCSHDKTWRLWDIETLQEILCQTGHSRAVYTCSLHPDGSLLYTGDLGGFGMVWDLRIGKGILPLNGHVKGVIASDFASNGFQLATGGDDNVIRIWDIRRRAQAEKIPAHIKMVSDLKFTSGKYLISASYDGTIKTWNNRDWSQGRCYHGHESKITSVSVSEDNQTMITTAIDRKFIIWKKTTHS